MPNKKEIERKLDYAKGYRDALVDTWEQVIKLATKGYSSRELQIMSKTQARDARQQMEDRIAQLEADYAQDDIIEPEDIKAAMAHGPAPVLSVNVKPGMIYMVKEPKPARCYKMFEREIAAGKVGLCVSRMSPREVRESYRIGKSQVIWLSQVEKRETGLPPSALGMVDGTTDPSEVEDLYIQPAALPSLFNQIFNFLDGHRGGIVMLEGLEYMNSHNSFDGLMHFLQGVAEHTKQTGSNLVVSVKPDSWDPKQLSQLETEMSQVI